MVHYRAESKVTASQVKSPRGGDGVGRRARVQVATVSDDRNGAAIHPLLRVLPACGGIGHALLTEARENFRGGREARGLGSGHPSTHCTVGGLMAALNPTL